MIEQNLTLDPYFSDDFSVLSLRGTIVISQLETFNRTSTYRSTAFKGSPAQVLDIY